MTENEFTEIIETSKELVLSSIGRHLYPRFHHAIDDVVQETYLRAYRSLAKNAFCGESSIRSWLYAIARNESLRMNGKLIREEMKVLKCIGQTKESGQCGGDEFDVVLLDLRMKIDLLPEIYKRVLLLLSFGYSKKEIAAELDIKHNTVKTRILRGKQLLQKLYEGEGWA